MTNNELLKEIERIEDRLFWLSMADKFTPSEREQFDSLHRELGHLLTEKNKRGL